MEADSPVGQQMNEAHSDAQGHCPFEGGATARRRPSLLDVLMPAQPPEPKNARVVRLFDCEGGRDEVPPQAAAAPAPEVQPAPAPQPRTEPKSREAAKAARNQSLLAAAGFLR